MNPYFSIEIDWNDDLAFTGANDNLSTRVRTNPAFTTQRGNDQIQDLSPPMAGSLAMNLDNKDRLLSPSNSGSAIFSSLHPGHLCSAFISILNTKVVFSANGFRYDSIDGLSSYTIVAGDVLQYDVRWFTGTQGFCAFDLDDGAGHRLKGSGAVDQNNLSADPQTNISAQANNFWYTRRISLSSLVGRTITRYMIGFENAAGGVVTPQAQFQNISIIGPTGNLKFAIFQTQNSYPITVTNRYNSNGGANDVTGSGNNTLFTGYIDNLVQNSDPSQQSVTVPALGLLSRLKGLLVSTPLYSSITTDQCIKHILDTCGISSTLYSLNTGNTTLDWWWLNNEDAFNAVQTLLATEGPGAKIFESNGSPIGKITFQNRQFRLTNATSTASQATLSTATGSEPQFSKPFQYDPGLKDIINIATTTTKTRVQQSSTPNIWTYSGNLILGPNQSITFNIQNTTSDPWTGTTFGWNVVSGSVGSSGINSNAFSYQITLTAGAGGCNLSGVNFAAAYVTVTSTVGVVNTINTSASQTTFGQKSFTLPIRAEIPFNTAQDLVNGIVAIYQNPRPIITITIFNSGNSLRYSNMIAREISDRITVVEPQSGLNGDMWIEFVAGSFPGVPFSMQLGCEQVWSTTFGVWGSAIYDTTAWGF